jgi:hypothetical protein
MLCASIARAETFSFDAQHWTLEGDEARFEAYRGRNAVFLKNGRATLRGVTAGDAVVEFDVAFPLERGFCGLAFRAADGDNYEEFYMRQHLSDMPDANQYSPVFNGDSGWQIYTGTRYCVPVKYSDNEWMHVRVAFTGSRGEAEIAGQPVPIAELKRDRIDGGLALYANIAGARFANFEVRREPVRLRTPPAAPETHEPGVVESWEVSTPFDGRAEIPASLQWKTIAAEKNGIANLARLAGPGKGRDTVIARVHLHSDRAAVRQMNFGFSDRVKIYLNGRLLYAGNDAYVSRDYRFLGSVGLFDTLALTLKKGDNDLSFAVTEAFGGWAVIAQFPDREGLRIAP